MRSSLRAVGRASLPRPRRSRCLLSVTLSRNLDLRNGVRHADALEGTRVTFWSRMAAGLAHVGLAMDLKPCSHALTRCRIGSMGLWRSGLEPRHGVRRPCGSPAEDSAEVETCGGGRLRR